MARFIADDDENNLVPPADVDVPPADDNVTETPDAPAQLSEDKATADEIDAADLAGSQLAPPEEEAEPVDPELAKPAGKAKPYSKYADMLGHYQDLIDQKRKNNMMLGMLAGGQIAGQAIAGGHSGKFDTDLSNIKMLQDMNNQGPEDYTKAVKQQGMDISLKDMQQMRDPTSKVSEFYRQMALSRKLPVTPEMSAWDIQNMAKVIGRPSASMPKFRSATFINKKTREVMQGNVEQSTGHITDLAGNPLDENWIERSKTGERTFIDPKTKERVGFEGNLGVTTGPVTGPGLTAPIVPATTKGPDGANNFELNRSYLNAQQAAQLDAERKAFNKDTQPNRDSIIAAQRVMDNLALGKKMGADDVQELRNQLALAYGQKGHITDSSLSRALSTPDLQGQFNAATNLAMQGTLDDKNRQWLMNMAKGLRDQNQKFLQGKSQVHVNNLYQDWSTSPNLSKYKIKPQDVSGMLSVDQAQMKPTMVNIQGVDTKRNFTVSQEQADGLIKSKKFKLIGPAQGAAPAPAASPEPSGKTETATTDEDDDE